MSGRSYTLDEILEDVKVSWFQYQLFILCGLMFMADSLEVTLLSFLSICAGVTFDLSNAEIASISSAVFAGQLVGAFVWGPIADRFGRRITFLVACSTMTLGGILSGVAPDYISLVIFRGICGIGVGGATIPFDLLAEFLPAEARGRFLLSIEYFWTVGSIFVICLAWVILRVYSWRELAIITCIPVLMSCLFSVVYLPESARWLMIQGRKEEAKEVIAHAAKMNGVDLGDFDLTISQMEIDAVAAENQKSFAEVYNPLFGKNVANISIPLLGVWMSFGFLYYGIILFITKIYSTDNDDDTGDDGSTCAFTYPPILENSISEFLGITLAVMAINTLGRVKTQWIGYLLGGVGVFLMGFFGSNAGVLLACGMVARAGAMGASCATWVATAELYPTNMRASGHSLCNVMGKLAGFCAPFVVFSNLSDPSVAAVLAAANITAAICSFLLPETAHMALDQGAKQSIASATESVFEKLQHAAHIHSPHSPHEDDMKLASQGLMHETRASTVDSTL